VLAGGDSEDTRYTILIKFRAVGKLSHFRRGSFVNSPSGDVIKEYAYLFVLNGS
jgi:hypothetical protein